MPTIEPATPTGRYVLEEWENEGGPDPQMRKAILKIEAEARLVPVSEALPMGERDCMAVIAWWQAQATEQGARAERAEAAAPDPVASPRWEEWARRLAPLVHDGLIDAPNERQIIDKAFALARLLDEHLPDPVASPPDSWEPAWVPFIVEAASLIGGDWAGRLQVAIEGAVASPAPLDVERLARALIGSDLMPRYREYAMRVPTMDPSETVEHLAATWAGWVAAAYARLTAAPDPVPTPALDVERLARALIAVREHANFPKRWVPDDYRWLARQLAAEYARPGQP